MTTWLNNNAKAAQVYGEQIQQLQQRLANPNISKGEYAQVAAEFRQIKSEAQAAGLTVNTFGSQLRNAVTMALGIGSVYQVISKVFQGIKSGISTIVELDTALVDLQKTTDASASELENFYNNANDIAIELGTSTKDVIQASADWSRLGLDFT